MRRISAWIVVLASAQCLCITLSYLLARFTLHHLAKFEPPWPAPLASRLQARFGLLLFLLPLGWSWLAARRELAPGSSGMGPALSSAGTGLTVGLFVLLVIDGFLLFG